MFRCCSLETSHPRLLPQSPKVCSVHLCLFFCFAYRVIITIFLNSISGSFIVTPWTVCNLPGSSVLEILQARILEWAATPGDLPDQGLDPGLLHCRHFLYCLSHREPLGFCPQDSTSLSNYLSPFTLWKTISKPLKQLIPFCWKSFNYECAYSPRDYICIYIFPTL